MWPNERLINLFGIELPIIQAPMAGLAFSDMVVAVSEAGGLGSLACALLSVEQARTELETIRRETSRPINLNFFCHQQPRSEPARETIWRRRLEAYYAQWDSITAPLFWARTALPSTTKCAISFWSSNRKSSASISVFRKGICWHAFGRQARRLFPRQLL